jgi:hypothetical protein
VDAGSLWPYFNTEFPEKETVLKNENPNFLDNGPALLGLLGLYSLPFGSP